MRDDELVAAALTGDTAAFAELFTRHRARVAAVLERMVGQESEDLVQEAALRAFLGLTQLRRPERFGAWLNGIAVNLAKMRLRRRALERNASDALRVDQSLEDRALLRLVREAVELLPRGQREAVLLHYVDDLSCDEIASILATTPGAVRVRLHRARAQLRDELAVLAPVQQSREELEMIEMTLADVLVRVADDEPTRLVSDHRIVLLRDDEGEGLLPIWVGAAEGNALALHLRGETTPRPLTSDLLVEVLRACGARIERVAVTEVRESTFYAVVVVGIDGRAEELDARPSDALNLAVRTGAPVYVVEEVLAGHAVRSDDVTARLETEGRLGGEELPEGVWRSLSAEILQALYRAP